MKLKKTSKDERAVVITATVNIIRYIDNSCLNLGGRGVNLKHYELCVKCVC